MITNHSYPSDKCTFELLSAYLDGEVTAEQREQVKALLAEDTEIQALYNRLLILREEIYNLPTPPSEYTAQQLSSAVFQQIDKQKKQKHVWLFGGGAIAAVLIASISSIMNDQPLWQMANNNKPSSENSEGLVIALNEPVIELPVKNENLAIPLDNPLFETIKNPQE
jgi:anti-sigma factor RsiW